MPMRATIRTFPADLHKWR